jgi:protein involved in temperature-dependent protein secretion
MQNSLERLFEGIATSLREDVAPAVEDPYARAQVTAAVELLGNLAARVEWRADLLREEIARVRDVLATGAERPALLDEPVPAEGSALAAAHAAHVDALAQAAVDEAVLREFLSWQVERELGLLRTGMYK